MIDIVVSVFLTAHTGFTNNNLNPVHPHIGIDYKQYSAGIYYNSERHTSVYATKTIYAGPVDIAAGFVTGYQERSVLPFVSISRYIGNDISVFALPSIDSVTNKPSLVLGIEYRFK